jgi:hypothetical protein
LDGFAVYIKFENYWSVGGAKNPSIKFKKSVNLIQIVGSRLDISNK